MLTNANTTAMSEIALIVLLAIHALIVQTMTESMTHASPMVLAERRQRMPRYIDTNYLDELITRLIKEGRNITRNDYKIINSILFEFPTADVVERKRGKWIQRSDTPCYYYCSNCHRVISVVSADEMEKFHAFCGTCGADMRGERQ